MCSTRSIPAWSLVSIARPDDRLGSFVAGDDRDGFLG
jgi:hypothetical protein